MAPTPDWHPPTPASTGGGAGAGDQLFRDDLRARMLEILASKDHADHELSKLAKFIEEKNSGLAVPPSSSLARQRLRCCCSRSRKYLVFCSSFYG